MRTLLDVQGVKEVLCEVRHGGKREAILYAAGANTSHGVRRSAEDKRKAVVSLLSDKEWRQWTDTAIAQAVHVDRNMVARYRNYMGENAQPTPDQQGYRRRKYMDRHGHVREKIVMGNGKNGETMPENTLKGQICPYCHQPMPKRIKAQPE